MKVGAVAGVARVRAMSPNLECRRELGRSRGGDVSSPLEHCRGVRQVIPLER
jgi:hypothetical protein